MTKEIKQGPKPVSLPAFPKPKDVGRREWGREILLVHAVGKYIGKLLLLKAGSGGGLQRHHLKDEASYVLEGEYQFTYADADGRLQTRVLRAGETVHIPVGCVHQGVALTDCKIIEFSTPHFNDRVRVEEEYGLPSGDGLPSTDLDEVETK